MNMGYMNMGYMNMGYMNIGYTFHKLLVSNDNNKIEELIKKIDIYNIKDNGILSLLLLYYIKNNDNRLDTFLSNIDYNKLMKRDYLILCNNYYYSNYNYSLDIFIKYLLNNKNIQLLTKDIDYLIENKLYKLLVLLNGLFIKTNINSLQLYDNINVINTIDNSILQNIKKHITNNIKINIDEFNNYLLKINYDYIIDGCNVLLNKGHVSKKNIENLYRLSTNRNTLVIIHKRHIQKNPDIIANFKKLNIKYFLTPFNNNDDLFIIIAFINNPNAYIISNDKYRDHVFNYNQSLFDYNQFKNYIKHHILSYTYNSLDNININLQSIYLDNNTLLIPHISGKYIKLLM
jgi:hypothetical protein